MKPTHLKTTVLLCAGLLLAGGTRGAEFFLRAAAITNTMPDGTNVVQWGFARDTSFGAHDGVVTVPGPLLVVPPGDTTLTIHLENDLTLRIPDKRRAVIVFKKIKWRNTIFGKVPGKLKAFVGGGFYHNSN